ncbi:MAG: hypothetical protein K6F92_00725 [Lachnospiraceae bacterium]|nr:hypothetical protein [Lachnospiraceae bacterium]
MDRILSKVAALGIPTLIFAIFVAFSGQSGSAAINVALNNIGFGNMSTGLLVLGILVLLSEWASRVLIKKLYQKKVGMLKDSGKSKYDIQDRIDTYPVSKQLRLELKDGVEK